MSHSNGAAMKLDASNGGKFFLVFDESSEWTMRDCETLGFNTYEAVFETGWAVKYDSVEQAAQVLNLPNLQAAIDNNNAHHYSGEPDQFGRKNRPLIDTRNGIWVLPTDPTFYLTTAGLAIDTDCHVLTESREVIPGLYAAGDVCGSVEEKDGMHYSYGFTAALSFGYQMAETLGRELV